MMETMPDTYLDGRSPAYDAVAKKLIATRSILSWILKYCVKEFKDTDLQEIKTHCIIGTPEVAEVPVHPDMTNSLRIRGENAEEKTVSEGVTTFDIRFQAVTPGGDPLTLIINVEAQQSSDVSYPMIKRALYYGSRLISSQNGVEFDHSHYEKIRKVYSIWLCMDTPQGKSGITRYVTQEITEYGTSVRRASIMTCNKSSWSISEMTAAISEIVCCACCMIYSNPMNQLLIRKKSWKKSTRSNWKVKKKGWWIPCAI